MNVPKYIISYENKKWMRTDIKGWNNNLYFLNEKKTIPNNNILRVLNSKLINKNKVNYDSFEIEDLFELEFSIQIKQIEKSDNKYIQNLVDSGDFYNYFKKQIHDFLI